MARFSPVEQPLVYPSSAARLQRVPPAAVDSNPAQSSHLFLQLQNSPGYYGPLNTFLHSQTITPLSSQMAPTPEPPPSNPSSDPNLPSAMPMPVWSSSTPLHSGGIDLSSPYVSETSKRSDVSPHIPQNFLPSPWPSGSRLPATSHPPYIPTRNPPSTQLPTDETISSLQRLLATSYFAV